MYKGKPAEAYIHSPAEMAKALAAKGVSPDKTIVVYDEGSSKYAGRMYWMLKYLGAPNVKMLNGNLKALLIQSNRLPESTEIQCQPHIPSLLKLL